MSIPTFIASAMAYALAHGEWAGIDAGERAKAFWALFSEEEPAAGLLMAASLTAGIIVALCGHRRSREHYQK